MLPDDHGIIFPGGFFLQTGSHKIFDHGFDNLNYDRTVVAPNGEDYLYLFTDPVSGTYLHLRYNLIRQQVDTPFICHGQAFFDDGQMLTFRSQESAQKHHALQLWTTPFVGPNYQSQVKTDSVLYKIGNRELVRGMAECQELLQLIEKDDAYSDLYMDLVKRATDILDGYFWLDRPETMQLSDPVSQIRDTAGAAVEEFDKVVRVRRDTEHALLNAQQSARAMIDSIGRATFQSVDDFVSKLASIRQQRGHAVGMRDLHFIDLNAVDSLEAELEETAERLGHRCVQFLLSPKSLEPYLDRIHDAETQVENVASAIDGKNLQESLVDISGDLELLIETVSQLKIEDLTQRTEIVDRTGNLLAELNRVRAGLKAKVRELVSGEMEADFASQTKLLDQAAAGALETADTPEKVDEALTRMMLQLEELEGRFAEFDELLIRLTEKRESLYEAFETRRQQLVEARSRRAESLASAANRILQGISSRATRFSDADKLRSYFVSDPMVDKVRTIANQLSGLGDSVRKDDVLSKLKSISDDAVRQLQDRNDLFTAGEAQIQLGKHQFSVNKQPIELTSVVRDGHLQIHITGTQFFQPLQHESLDASTDLWTQLLPSESDSVYRAEYLAMSLFEEWDSASLNSYLKSDPEERIERVRAVMQSRHDEGYSRGVHDRDAARILWELIDKDSRLGILKYAPEIRGPANFTWRSLVPAQSRENTERWIAGFATVASILPRAKASQLYLRRLARLLRRFGRGILEKEKIHECAAYLFDEIRVSSDRFASSPRASELLQHFDEHLPADQRKKLHQAIEENREHPVAAWTLALDAVDGYLAEQADHQDMGTDVATNYRKEVAAMLLLGQQHAQLGPDVPAASRLEGMLGDHSKIQAGVLDHHFHEFRSRLMAYRRDVLPRFHALRTAKHELLVRADKRLRTEEFKPKVLTSFVRNQLIDEVYLPLIGDNLAKQIGASGDGMRTDRMGLLLLISPPGYGKTTLMEYIANRLGLVFVKVNGPALGHNVTSLDPSEASNASAREEVERINMSLEMGDNVMLYLDDIQHCNPELLQKFIPLCDATRRIEGVWNGDPKAYDLRGRKFVVVMAGNPYTESGDRFQIPDMLSNRADVYNLGEIIGESREAFEISYIENCLTSNTVLQPLARASSKDQRAVIHAAQRGSTEGLDLESNLGADRLADVVSVLSKLLRVRDIVLRVNRTYIQSAAQADAYRTEPPFKLQGSYRNMNRIAERVVSVMNDEELESLIIANYEQDAQTLTRDGESNLLKFKELMGNLTETEVERWNSIKYAYVESVRMQGIEGDDATAQVLRSISGLRDGLESIRRTLSQAVASDRSEQRSLELQASLLDLNKTLASIGPTLQSALGENAEKLTSFQQELPDPKVLVQHSVPRVMTDLIQSQFQLLYDGFRPILESSSQSTSQLERLREAIENCLQDYKDLQSEIESAKDTSG